MHNIDLGERPVFDLDGYIERITGLSNSLLEIAADLGAGLLHV